MAIRDLNPMKRETREEGLEEGKLGMARNLLSMGLTVEQIVKATDLSVNSDCVTLTWK